MNCYNRIDLHVTRCAGRDTLTVFGYVDGDGSGPRPIPADCPPGADVLARGRSLLRDLRAECPGAVVTLFVDTGGVESVVRSER